MPTAEARVQTDQPSRYLVQLCKHAQGMGRHLGHTPRVHADGQAPPQVQHVECSDTEGIVRLTIGQWTMQATAGALIIRAAADKAEDLRRIQGFVTGRLEKIGRRDGLTVSWRPSEDPSDEHGKTAGISGKSSGEAKPSRHRRGIATFAALALLGIVARGAIWAAPHLPAWTWVGALILTVVAAKIVAIVLGRRTRHPRRRTVGVTRGASKAETWRSAHADAVDR